MSEQNPTQKGAPGEAPIVVQALCPHCGRALPGMNILTMELPTPKGGMVWLLPSCPFVEVEEGKAVDGGKPCGRIIGAQFSGEFTAPQIARPGWVG